MKKKLTILTIALGLAAAANAQDTMKGDKPAPGKSSSARSPLELNLTDSYGNAIFCPHGTIPMTRLTLERLTTFRTLSDFFAKRPRSLGPLLLKIPQPELQPCWPAR